MDCSKHQGTEASGMCVYCGKPFCKDCLVEVKGKMYCKDDIGNVIDEAKVSAKPAEQTPMVFMNAGGASSSSSAASSNSGSRRVPPYPTQSGLMHVVLLFLTAGIGNVLYFLHVSSKQKEWNRMYR